MSISSRLPPPRRTRASTSPSRTRSSSTQGGRAAAGGNRPAPPWPSPCLLQTAKARGPACSRDRIPLGVPARSPSRRPAARLRVPFRWKAFDTIARITKRGGLTLHLVPWSYHFHATPADYYRFSHQALASLLERGFEVLAVGLDVCTRPLRKTVLGWGVFSSFAKTAGANNNNRASAAHRKHRRRGCAVFGAHL